MYMYSNLLYYYARMYVKTAQSELCRSLGKYTYQPDYLYKTSDQKFCSVELPARPTQVYWLSHLYTKVSISDELSIIISTYTFITITTPQTEINFNSIVDTLERLIVSTPAFQRWRKGSEFWR